MTPPPAIALHASKRHHKTAVLIQSDPSENEKGSVQCETEANGNETGQEWEWWAPRLRRGEEDGSCSRDDGDLPTAPSEQPTSAQGAHQETAPPTARGEQRSVEEQVGWGRESSWSRLCSSMLIRHKGIGLMSHKGIDSMTLFTGSEGASHAAEGTQHTARLKPTVSWYYTLYVKILHWFT